MTLPSTDTVDVNDWLADPNCAWWLCKAEAVQQARRLVEAAHVPFETHEDVRLVSVDDEMVLAPVDGGSESWLSVPPDLVLDAGANR